MSEDTNQLPRCPVCGLSVEEEDLKESTPFPCRRSSCNVQLEYDGDALHIKTYQLADHYSYCVFPFSFLESEAPFQRLRSSKRWEQQRFFQYNQADVDRTEYFLPYIRRFQFPSLYEFGEDKHAGEPTCQHFDFDLSLLEGYKEDAVHLTLEGRNARKNMLHAYDITIEAIKLVVYDSRMGFLLIRFGQSSEQASYFEQMNATFFMRLLTPLHQDFPMPTLTGDQQTYQMTQLLPYLLAEFGPSKYKKASPVDFSKELKLPVVPAYEDRMMLYTFSCIKQDTMLDDVESNERLLDRNTLVNFDNTFHAQPSKSEEEELTRWSRKRWQGFSKEGGCLVAFDTNRFHLDFLGQYHSSYYLDIFILAVLQRITLLSLFERMADIQALTRGDRKSRRAFRRVHKDLLLFKNKIWFSQITNRERGLALWRMWQSTFENRTLLEEVNEQSKELNAYIRTQTREKIEWMVRIAGFLGATVPALLTAKTFFNKYSWGPTLRWSLLSAILLGTGIFAWRVLVKGDDE